MFAQNRTLYVFLHLGTILVLIATTAARSFTVGKNCFLKDGKPFQYVSGTAHYWRTPPEHWEDNFRKMRAGGLTAVDTYLIWTLHEHEAGAFNFSGSLNFTRYFELAQKSGLLVVLRPGPFIAAEVDLGGLPYWLVRENPSMKLRTADPSFLYFVERFYNQSLPLVRKYLYENGGPIITVQVENEYGAFGCDVNYLIYIRDLFRRHLGDNVVLTTNNYPEVQYLTCGTCPGTLTTGDFGTPSISGKNVSYYLDNLRKFNPDGPLVDTEFYTGWLDTWDSPHSTVDVADIIESAQVFIDRNVSFNFYVYHGGTTFGFLSAFGVVTSYDYDAPLNEAGDPTEKYYKLRKFLGKYFPLPPGPVPQPSPKAAYGPVQMRYIGNVYDNLKQLCPDGPVLSTYPLSFENLKHGFGFVLYRTTITQTYRDPAVLAISKWVEANDAGLRDRAIVLVDQVPVGILGRDVGLFSMDVFVQPGQTLDFLVQNEGRGGFFWGSDIKGIVGSVSLDGSILTGWEMYPLDLPNFPGMRKTAAPLGFRPRRQMTLKWPAFYSGTFWASQPPLDTYVQLNGWTNGFVFINGFNLGRYWPVEGPQITLYVPEVYLQANQRNIVEVFELEKAPCDDSSNCFLRFVDTPILNGTVPTRSKRPKKFPHLRRFN